MPLTISTVTNNSTIPYDKTSNINSNILKMKKYNKNVRSRKKSKTKITDKILNDKDEFKILKIENVSLEFRDSYIYSGYRSPNSSFISCLKSLFNLNSNETINFWTHFMPSLVVLIFLIKFSIENDVFNDNFIWPFVIYLSTASFYMFMSSMAHALNCMSSIARHVCFILDYLSISMYGMGCSIAYKAYSLSLMPHYTTIFFDYYVTIAMCITIMSNIMISASRFVISHNARGLLRLISLASQYIFVSLPLFYRLVISYFPATIRYMTYYLKFIFYSISSSNQAVNATINNNDDDNEYNKFMLNYQLNMNNESNYYFLLHIILTITSAFLYISHIPERFWPGKFDLIGQSHQLFHIVSAFSTFVQIKALNSDMLQLRPLLHNLLNSENHTTLQPMSTSNSQLYQFYTTFNSTTNISDYYMQLINTNVKNYRINENLIKETHVTLNNTLLNLTSESIMTQSLSSITSLIDLTTNTLNTSILTTINFYTYSMKHIDFLTVTLSPYFRTKLTYAFIMFCCIIFNTLILIYYYLKALYFNPWNKLNSNENVNKSKFLGENYYSYCCDSTTNRRGCSNSRTRQTRTTSRYFICKND